MQDGRYEEVYSPYLNDEHVRLITLGGVGWKEALNSVHHDIIIPYKHYNLYENLKHHPDYYLVLESRTFALFIRKEVYHRIKNLQEFQRISLNFIKIFFGTHKLIGLKNEKGLIIFFLFLLFVSFSYAENLKAGIKRNEYPDYLEMVNLSAEQREKVLRIRNEENFVLKPLTLDIESKERGLELLNSLQCKTFDFECKKKLKLDIEQRQMEYNEALRKINQKKNYYKLRYRNVLTREQDYKIQK